MPYARDGLGDIPSILQGKRGNTQETLEHALVNAGIVPPKAGTQGAASVAGGAGSLFRNPLVWVAVAVVGGFLIFGGSSRRSLF